MIKLTINGDDDKIKVGSKIVFKKGFQDFGHDGDTYNDVDCNNAVATVHVIDNDYNSTTYKCTFDDVSFLPSEIQSVPYWYLIKPYMELY